MSNSKRKPHTCTNLSVFIVIVCVREIVCVCVLWIWVSMCVTVCVSILLLWVLFFDTFSLLGATPYIPISLQVSNFLVPFPHQMLSVKLWYELHMEWKLWFQELQVLSQPHQPWHQHRYVSVSYEEVHGMVWGWVLHMCITSRWLICPSNLQYSYFLFVWEQFLH